MEIPEIDSKPYEYLLILDFEATCNANDLPKPTPQGILSPSFSTDLSN